MHAGWARFAAGFAAGALIASGVYVAFRPVGDQSVRHEATAPARGIVSRTHNFAHGGQIVTVTWYPPGAHDPISSEFAVWDEPRWETGEAMDLLFDPRTPRHVVMADAYLTNNSDARIDAAFQSVVLFAFAAMVLTFFVIWPPKRSRTHLRHSLPSVWRALGLYVFVPAVSSIAVLAAAWAVQDLAEHSNRIGDADALSLCVLVPLVWLTVRAIRGRELARLVLTADDSADPRALITGIKGRRFLLRSRLADESGSERGVGGVRVKLLTGQTRNRFAVGDEVRRYGRPTGRGATLITTAGKQLLIGFAKHPRQ